jgi:hypothetical protein
LEPYTGIEPTLNFNRFLEPGIEKIGISLGYAVPLGLKAYIWEGRKISVGLFAEARLTYNPYRIDTVRTVEFGRLLGEIKTNFLSKHFLLGMSLNFK